MRPRRDGVPGPSQPFPTLIVPLLPLLLPVAVGTAALASILPHLRSTCDGSVPIEAVQGVKCFGSSLVPHEQFTWHHALALDGRFSHATWPSADSSGKSSSSDFMALREVGFNSLGLAGVTALPSSFLSDSALIFGKMVQQDALASTVRPLAVGVPAGSPVWTEECGPPAWTEVDPKAFKARLWAMRPDRWGVPKYELCFQGF